MVRAPLLGLSQQAGQNVAWQAAGIAGFEAVAPHIVYECMPEIRGVAVSFHDRILCLATLGRSATLLERRQPGPLPEPAGLSRASSIVDLFNIAQ